MDIVVMVLDSIHAHNFYLQMVAGTNMLLFLELIIVLLCTLLKYKIILVLGKGLTQGLNDTAMSI